MSVWWLSICVCVCVCDLTVPLPGSVPLGLFMFMFVTVHFCGKNSLWLQCCFSSFAVQLTLTKHRPHVSTPSVSVKSSSSLLWCKCSLFVSLSAMTTLLYNSVNHSHFRCCNHFHSNAKCCLIACVELPPHAPFARMGVYPTTARLSASGPTQTNLDVETL